MAVNRRRRRATLRTVTRWPWIAGSSFAVLAAALAVVWFGVVRAPAPPASLPAAAATPPPAEAVAVARTPAAVDEPANAPGPAPTGARLTLRIVDDATGAPVAGAVVRWVDGSFVAAIADERTPTAEVLHTDRERLAQQFGRTATSDGAGGVAFAIAAADAPTLVVARHGSRYGDARFDHRALPPAGGHVLRLRDERLLRVQVLDVTGQPVAGVPLEVLGRDAAAHLAGRLFPDRAFTYTEGPQGLAVLRNVGDWFTNRERPAPVAWTVGLHLPGAADVAAPFAADAPPAEPIVLHLPACGTVWLRGEACGMACPRHGQLLLTNELTVDRAMLFTRAAPIGDDGWARFDLVPIGQSYVGRTSAHGPGLTATFAGPTAAGEVLRVVLAPNAAQTVLTGRAVDADGQPLADAALQAIEHGDRWPARSDVRTDGEARFVIPGTPKGVSDGYYCEVELLLRGAELPRLRARVPVDPASSGQRDVGTVVLRPEPILVTGHLNTGGAPRATLRLELFETADAGAELPFGPPDFACQLRDDGSFVCSGEARTTRLLLQVRGAGTRPLARREVAVGARDVVLDVELGSELRAAARAPAGTLDDITVLLQPSEPAADRAPVRTSGLIATDAGRGEARWLAVPPGRYDVVFTIAGLGDELARIADVVAPTAEPDPRLADVDLHGTCRALAVELTFAAGGPPEAPFAAVFPLGTGGNAADAVEWRGIGCGAGDTIAVPPAATTFVVACRGYQPATVTATGDRLAVQLTPWPRASVTFADMPPLPAEVRAWAMATPLGPARLYRSQRHAGDRRELVAVRERGAELVAGRAELPIADEPLAITVRLAGPGGIHDLALPTPITLLPADRDQIVRLPVADWQQAFARVAAPK